MGDFHIEDKRVCLQHLVRLFFQVVFPYVTVFPFPLQGIFQLLHACNSHTHEAALFQNIFKFCTFLPKFSNILPFLALLLKNHMHALTFQNSPPLTSFQLELFLSAAFSHQVVTDTVINRQSRLLTTITFINMYY